MGNVYKSFGTSTLANIDKYTTFNGQAQLFNEDLFINAQQKFRFLVLVDDIPAAYISRIDRPSYAIETQEYILLDHVVRYPVRVKWEQISLTVKEIFGGQTVGSVGNNLMNKLLAHAYYYPDDIIDGGATPYGTRNLSKENLKRALGDLKIVSVRPDGSIFETWTIYNGMITGIKFSDNTYSDDSLTDATLTIQYDWARLQLGST